MPVVNTTRSFQIRFVFWFGPDRLEANRSSALLQAFSSLAEAAYEATDAAEDQEEPSTYCLSSSFEIIVQKLLETTDR